MFFEKLLNDIVSGRLTKLAADYTGVAESIEGLEKVSASLEKVAAMPVDEIVKVADAVKGVAKYASDAIGSLQAEKKYLMDKVATYEKAAQVREIVEQMIEKGAVSKSEFGSKVKELMEKSAFDLEVHKKALEMIKSAGSNGSGIGTLEENGLTQSNGKRVNPMEEVIMSA